MIIIISSHWRVSLERVFERSASQQWHASAGLAELDISLQAVQCAHLAKTQQGRLQLVEARPLCRESEFMRVSLQRLQELNATQRKAVMSCEVCAGIMETLRQVRKKERNIYIYR
jgi:hypothetical protein